MASKRTAGSPARAAKRSRTCKLIPTVVDALADAEELPADLRTLLKVTLPTVLSTNKVDRHGFEVEVVDQAQKALATMKASLEQAHKAAVAKQSEVIAPAELTKRSKVKAAAEASLEGVKAKLETTKTAKSAAHKAVQDAQSALKTAEKEAAAVEKDMQGHANKKAALSDVLATEFALLRDGTSAGAAGQKAVKKLLALGKEYALDSTLLTTLPITCKKKPEARSEFEAITLTSLQAGIDLQIDRLTQKLAESQPAQAQTAAAAARTKEAYEKSEAAQAAANEDLATMLAAHKEAVKEVAKADAVERNIWADMKNVCDAQDSIAGDLKNFTENIIVAFQQLKEKEPEPEAVAPAPVEEETAAEPAAEAVAETA